MNEVNRHLLSDIVKTDRQVKSYRRSFFFIFTMVLIYCFNGINFIFHIKIRAKFLHFV